MTTAVALVIITMILSVSITWTNAVGAPWLPSSMKTVHDMLELAEIDENDTLYDLGCGDGRTLVTAARRYGAKAVGIEIDPLRYIWCQILITVMGLRGQVNIRYGNFFNHDLSEATVVTCYLLPETNRDLEWKLSQELGFGTRVVSNTFRFPNLGLARQKGNIRVYAI
jgi:16S rRNA A1518/A1519 N6-dimethyltransferase RsmA/KsgA/DIM1 with predicted DNA glycosylase/AP lyase activity